MPPSSGDGRALPPPAPTPDRTARTAVRRKLAALPPIRFAPAGARLTPAGRAAVARAAALLKTAPNLPVRVNGYTDDLGDWDVNLTLSRRRSRAVRQALIANGVPAARITAVGWSEEHPKLPNTSAANRAANRRAEITVG